MRVLDVGGLGGPARTLATEIGCSVEVLDVTEEFCRAGEMLITRTGLGDLVTFRHASALDMPHPDASFDTVWMQHSSMNIADKERLYAKKNGTTRRSTAYCAPPVTWHCTRSWRDRSRLSTSRSRGRVGRR
jgi:hypothetical protein